MLGSAMLLLKVRGHKSDLKSVGFALLFAVQIITLNLILSLKQRMMKAGSCRTVTIKDTFYIHVCCYTFGIIKLIYYFQYIISISIVFSVFVFQIIM